MKIKQEIPIFFSSDDRYVPCLSVAIKSLIENSSIQNEYRIIILNTGISENRIKDLKEMETKNVKISFENIDDKTTDLRQALALRLRDYYSATIYYRMFIPSLFPGYEKAIYLDSDMIIKDDIANLYNIDLGNNMIAAVRDAVVNDSDVFKKYSKVAIGIDPKKYFNSGMLVMNLREMRKAKIEDKFTKLLLKYNLDTVAPDQDYLNALCKGKVKFLPETWNKMPDFGKKYEDSDLHIIHYNMYRKPWHYKDVPYAENFWSYAKETKYYDHLQEQLQNFSEDEIKCDLEAGNKMQEYCKSIMKQELKFSELVEEFNEYYEYEFEMHNEETTATSECEVKA